LEIPAGDGNSPSIRPLRPGEDGHGINPSGGGGSGGGGSGGGGSGGSGGGSGGGSNPNNDPNNGNNRFDPNRNPYY